jgi:hypothetical protein
MAIGQGVVVVDGLDGLWLDPRDTAFWRGEGLLSFEAKGTRQRRPSSCERAVNVTERFVIA